MMFILAFTVLLNPIITPILVITADVAPKLNSLNFIDKLKYLFYIYFKES